ncbi:Tkl1p [Malassezia vespertilionis]|uniref:Transketolase n=1 Tax=Malassezia vespertilionis TaxID=2020962 RepID=A0A2N1J9G2_9BASI|nr:Tkl1p [Malassezia vespertilionis]
MASEFDNKAVSTIRTLAADITHQSNSGHPGAPMGLAPVAHILWSRFIRCDPKDSHWPNRDRFVLSNGHACALQYIMLHLLGYKLSMDDLKSFRTLDSLTPGHPEFGHTDGIEVTTGPLGQGIANAVGLAIAGKNAAATFNKPDFEIFNNMVYCVLGDGCLQEGVCAEALSLAGHLRLNNLVAIYDDNGITIDGDTACSFTEDVEMRLRAYRWNVLHVLDGNTDLDSLVKTLEEAKTCKDMPTMIRVKTTIGYGSENQGTASVHGSPLKEDDIIQLKKAFGFNPDETFVVPKDVQEAYDGYRDKGGKLHSEWKDLYSKYSKKYPDEAAQIDRRLAHKLPEGWEKKLPTYKPSDKGMASRKLSEAVLNAIADEIPELLSGSADLTGSNNTRWSNAVDFQPPETRLGNYDGRYIRYGVREHGMGAIMNGIHAYGLHIPSSGTFLNFVSYAIGAVRLSALSKFQVIWIATHDSIGLGEDGPTHQPVETAAALRSLPNLDFWRPADGNETSGAYKVALESYTTPSVLALTRQNLPQLEGSSIENTVKGGYAMIEDKEATITLVSTGSEVHICAEALKLLKEQGIKARLVSMPCFRVFDLQPLEYRLKVLPSGHPILSVEAYTTFGWGKYAHVHHGINTFGASAPYEDVYRKFKMTPEDISSKAARVVDAFKNSKTPLVSPIEVEAEFAK